MTKLKQTLMAGAVALAMSGAAQATTITFDGLADYMVFSSYSTGGLTFTNNGYYAYIWDSGSPNSNGTDSLIFAGFGSSDYMAITRTGGGLFDLGSIDMTISWYDYNSSETIYVNGNPIVLGQGLQTFSLGLTGVSQVNITGVPSTSGYWLLDNVNGNFGENVNAAPEPETYAMLLAGLGLLGFVARRRQRKLAAA